MCKYIWKETFQDSHEIQLGLETLSHDEGRPTYATNWKLHFDGFANGKRRDKGGALSIIYGASESFHTSRYVPSSRSKVGSGGGKVVLHQFRVATW